MGKKITYILVAASVIGLTACGNEGARTYPLSKQQAMLKLGGGSLPSTAGVKNGAEQIAEGGLRWNGSKGFTCEAAMKEVGDNQVEIAPSCGYPQGGHDGKGTTDMMIQIASANFQEYVESTLDGRPFDKRKMDTMMAATMMSGTDEIFADVEKSMDEYDAKGRAVQQDIEARQAAASFGQPTGMGEGATFGDRKSVV